MPDSRDTVEVPSIAYREMEPTWKKLHALLGGTEAMRKAGREFLPQEPKEQDKAYRNRVERSFLYGAYKDTISKIVSRPYSMPVQLNGETGSEMLDMIEDDVDLTGRNLTQFGRETFWAACVYGLTHCLVDFSLNQRAETLAEERAMRAQPTFIHVIPPQLIGWRYEPDPLGGQSLSQIRIQETRIEPDGEYAECEVDIIRVYTRESWEIHRKDKDSGEYVLEDQGTHSFGAVPLFTFYTNRTGDLTASPPLEDLAWLNLAHWQSLSDQRNILRFSRIGVMFASGFTKDEIEDGITIGPTTLVRSSSAEAKLQYVEHQGRAMQAGQEDLDRLEQRMETLGLQPLIERTGDQTATGKAIDESKVHTQVQAWIRGQEAWILSLYEAASQWVGVELPIDFGVNINNDFGISLRADEDIRHLDNMNSRGKITDELYLSEVKRRGVIAESVDIEEELENAAAQQANNLPEPSLDDQVEDIPEEVEEAGQEETAA